MITHGNVQGVYKNDDLFINVCTFDVRYVHLFVGMEKCLFFKEIYHWFFFFALFYLKYCEGEHFFLVFKITLEHALDIIYTLHSYRAGQLIRGRDEISG